MFNNRPDFIERDSVAILGEKNNMRIADIDSHRRVQFSAANWPSKRHGERVHRIGQRDCLPLKARDAHIDAGAAILWANVKDPASGFDAGLLPMEHGDSAGGIAASLNLAAIGIEYPHFEVAMVRWLQHDELVAANPAVPVGNGLCKALRDRGQGGLARIQHDKVVSKAMHLGEGRLSECAGHEGAFMHEGALRPVSAAFGD